MLKQVANFYFSFFYSIINCLFFLEINVGRIKHIKCVGWLVKVAKADERYFIKAKLSVKILRLFHLLYVAALHVNLKMGVKNFKEMNILVNYYRPYRNFLCLQGIIQIKDSIMDGNSTSVVLPDAKKRYYKR